MIDISLNSAEWLLVLVWFSVALWNTSVGPTGGITFAAMASVLPPTVVIPIQAVVEASSSIFRVLLLRKFIDFGFLLPFVIGGSIGFGVGLAARAYTPPSDDLLRVIMGSFILITTWIPLAKLGTARGSFPLWIGTITSFISLFVGGIASLIAAAIDQRHDDHSNVIATMTSCLIFQHTVKVIIFGLLGFSFYIYAELMILMFIAAIAGTWIGKRILLNVPQSYIKPVFKILVTVLGLNVLIEGLYGWM